MQTKKPHDSPLIILLGVGAGILLLAALGLFLVQSPDAPLPWEKPTQTSTDTVAPPTATQTQTATPTSTGTRRPTRTPIPMTFTPVSTDISAPTNSPTIASTTALPTSTYTPPATATFTQAPAQSTATHTPLPPTITNTPQPTAATPPTATLSPTPLSQPILITGRVVDQGAAIANVTITLDGPTSLTAITDVDGAYQFQVDWVDELYYVVFSLETNTQLSPSSNYVAWSWVKGSLFADIELPDLEISAAPNGVFFSQISPADGSSYSAAQITFANPLTFTWNPYPQAEQYWVDLGRLGEEQRAWNSIAIMDEYADFDGNLNNGTKISQGNYWWAVGSIKNIPGFQLTAYTQKWTLAIIP